MARKKPGSKKLSRTETVTVRLDPRLRYLADLAARKERRSLSSFIEIAVEQHLDRVPISDTRSLSDVANRLWDVNAPQRFCNLARDYPDLLDHEEQQVWALIRRHPIFWADARYTDDTAEEIDWTCTPDQLIAGRVSRHWEYLWQVIRGEADEKDMPTKEPGPPPNSSVDDDIPF